MRDAETILRFFAAYLNYKNYEKPITVFLNNFMEANRNIDSKKSNEWEALFSNTLGIIFENIGSASFPKSGGNKSFNRAIFESVMVAVARLKRENKLDTKNLKRKYDLLLKDKVYSAAITSQTSDKKRYLDRINLAYQILS